MLLPSHKEKFHLLVLLIRFIIDMYELVNYVWINYCMQTILYF